MIMFEMLRRSAGQSKSVTRTRASGPGVPVKRLQIAASACAEKRPPPLSAWTVITMSASTSASAPARGSTRSATSPDHPDDAPL